MIVHSLCGVTTVYKNRKLTKTTKKNPYPAWKFGIQKKVQMRQPCLQMDAVHCTYAVLCVGLSAGGAGLALYPGDAQPVRPDLAPLLSRYSTTFLISSVADPGSGAFFTPLDPG